MTECGHWPSSLGSLPSWGEEATKRKVVCNECARTGSTSESDEDEEEDDRRERKNKALWICLPCLASGKSVVLCSDKKHAQAHYRISTHVLVANLKNDTIWCFQCNAATQNKDAAASSSTNITPSFDPLEAYANPEGGQIGLFNQENTCFFNSSLQALLHCPPLIGYFLSSSDILSSSSLSQLAREFSIVVQKAWVPSSRPLRVFTPRGLFACVLKINPYFRGYGQHDAQELLRCLLDTLHEGLQIKCEYDYLRHPLPPEEDSEEEKDEETKTKQITSVTTTSPSSPPSFAKGNSKANNSNEGTKKNEHSNKRGSRKLSKKQEKQQVVIQKQPEKITTVAAFPSEIQEKEEKKEGTGGEDEKKKEEAKKKKFFEPSSIIADIFQGQLLSEITCLQCGTISVKQEPFYDLSLELPKDKTLKKVEQERGHTTTNGGGWLGLGNVLQYVGLVSTPISLETCLHSFCVSEELLKGDQYKCEKCKEKVDAKKTLAISGLPEILCLHIKRFAHNSYYGSKVSRHVTFPMQNLDMAPFFRSPPVPTKKKRKQSRVSASSASSASSSSSVINGSSKYDLFAMVRHMGSSGGGHYIAYTKSHVTQKWLRFSDDEVAPVSEESIPKQEAYILFYRRQPDVSSQRLVRDLASAGQTGSNDGDEGCFVSSSWLRKIQFMSRGYPLDNRYLFCSHGYEHSIEELQKRGVRFSKANYQQLVQRFGGGPLAMGSFENDVNQRCPTCNVAFLIREEKAHIEALDALPEKMIYDIHFPWLTSWEEFVSGKGPRPGPISNSLLFDGETLKAGLVRGQDFMGVKDTVWEGLHKIYGGGPIISRKAVSNLQFTQTKVEGDDEEEHEKNKVQATNSQNIVDG